ncbi:MAG: PIN domain-containing protein [Chloroflexi bacterium]|nr:PIN domain-containing protein [Chloroflexota bacterium]
MPDRAPVFLDTAYVYALVNTRDQWHEAATTWERRLAAEKRRLLTTEFVLLEIADGLAAVRYRVGAIRIIAALRTSSLVEIVPATSNSFAEAFELYQNREDKD